MADESPSPQVQEPGPEKAKPKRRILPFGSRPFQSPFSKSSLLLSIDFGTSHVKTAFLRQRRGRLVDVQTATVQVPMKSRGDWSQRRALLQKTLKEQAARFKVPFLAEVVLAVSGPEVTVSSLLVPRAPLKKLLELVRAELAQTLSYPVQEAVWAYTLPPDPVELGGGKVAVFVAAAPAQWILELTRLCRSAQLVPTRIVPDVSAIQRLVQKSDLLKTNPGLVFLDIGATASTLVFIQQGFLEFLRPISVGADHFTRGLMRTVRTPQGERTITASEAEEIIRLYGIGTEEPRERWFGLTSEQVYGMLRPHLEYLFLEVQRTLRYYRQAFKRSASDRILIGGGGASIPQLVEFLHANMDDASAEAVDPIALVGSWAESTEKLQAAIRPLNPQLAVVLGAACPETPAAAGKAPIFYRYAYRFEWFYRVARAAALVGLLATLALSVSIRIQRYRYEGIVKSQQERLTELEKKVQRIQELQSRKAFVEERTGLLAKAVNRQPLWAGVLKELGWITPPGIRLSQLSVREGKVPLELEIRGEIRPSYSSVEVLYSQYQLALEESPFFRDIRLTSMKKDLYSPTALASFELICRLEY